MSQPSSPVATDDLAGRDRRLAAVSIDALLAVTVAFAPFAVAILAIGPLADYAALQAPTLLIGLLATFGLQILQWVLLHRLGQTLGKMAMGVRVIRTDGTLPGFARIVVLRRWLFSVLGAIPYLGALVHLVDYASILGKRRQCLHDSVADTLVVRTEGGWV